MNNARHPCVTALLALSASEHPVCKLGGGVPADSITPKNLMIDYVKDQVAADAAYAVKFVDNGISSPVAMYPIASPVSNVSP